MVEQILREQLERLGLTEDVPPDAKAWREVLGTVLRIYREAEQERHTLERSLVISSGETQALHHELRRSEANLKVLVEASPNAMIVQGEHDARIRYANPAMARLVGEPDPAKLIGLDPIAAFVDPRDRDLALSARRKRAEGAEASDEVRLSRRDRTVVIAQEHSSLITFDDERAWLCVLQDVTDKVRAEDELRASEERYRMLFEESPVLMMLFDPRSLQILQVNGAAERLYGYTTAEFLAMRVADLKPPEDVPKLVEGMAKRQEKVKWTGTMRHRKKDGTFADVAITSHQVTLGGRPAILAVGIDETAKRQLEDQLRQSQKMEAVGRLAGGIAHDFNNLLAVILGDAELALGALAKDDPVRAEIKEIEAAGRRASMLTQQLLTFSRRQNCRPQVLALNTIVTNMEKMLCRVIGEDVEIVATLAPRLGSIEVDPVQAEQVILNLAINARDAMPDGGKLVIETRNTEVAGAEAIEMGIPPGRYVVLSVVDDGAGMDVATRARIFEPFFTTKEVGKGTGLGLATVFGIVKQAGGGIRVRSSPGAGSTFSIYLPRVDDRRDTMPPRGSPSPGSRGTETILVVEDEESVRRVMCRLLGARGYAVFEATSPRAALDIVRDGNRRIDLVVTDVVMPEMDGPSMVKRILEVRPAVKVLYMSGYADHRAIQGPAIRPGDHFIPKPFTMDEMGLAVRRALEGRRLSSSREMPAVRI